MATDVPEGEEPEAPKPPHDADPLGSDPGTVPLVPPGDPSALPGQLETAPDGSIRPVPPGDGSHELAPPAPGLLQEPLIQPPPAPPPPQSPGLPPQQPAGSVPLPDAPLLQPGTHVTATGDIPVDGSPPWTLAEHAASTPAEGQPETERATWPTVEAHGANDPPAAPHEQAPSSPDAGAGAPSTPPLVQAHVAPVATPTEAPPATVVRPPESTTASEEMYDVPPGNARLSLWPSGRGPDRVCARRERADRQASRRSSDRQRDD